MNNARVFGVLSALMVVLAAVPAAAVQPLPDVCGNRPVPLAEGEYLVEHTLFLRGLYDVGNVDQVEAFSRLSVSRSKPMTAEEPTGSRSPRRRRATGTNPDFHGNPAMAYWSATLDDEPRIVCAGATFYGAAQGNLSARLFFDQGFGSTEVASSAQAVRHSGDTVTKWTAVFRNLDHHAWDLTLQITPSTAGTVLYDSTDHPSSFTFVTVERDPGFVPLPPVTP